MAYNAGKILKKAGTWLFRIVGILILLLVLLWGMLLTQWGKNIVKNLAVDYLQKKLKTRVSIDELTVEWLTHIRLKGIELEDRQKRKLFSIQEFDAKYDLSGIFDNQFTLKDLAVRGVTIQLIRERKDSLFNFSFIPATFSPGDKNPAKEIQDSSVFRLGLGTISLSAINFRMDDWYGGQLYDLSIASFKAAIDTLDLNTLDIHAKYLFTDSVNCTANFFAPYKIKPSDTGEPIPFSVAFDTVHMAGSSFNLEDTVSHINVKTRAGLLAGNHISYNQAKMNARIGYAALTDHTTRVKINSSAFTSKEIKGQPEKKATGTPFTFFAKALAIQKNNFEFDDEGVPAGPPKKMDFNHLAFTNILLNATNTRYNGKEYFSEINQCKLEEKSGFRVQQLKAIAGFSDTGVSLKQLVLNTAQNQLQGNVEVAWNSISQITTSPRDTKIQAVISNAQIQLDELLYFQPGLLKNTSFRPLLGKKFFINTTVSGSLDKLNIPSLSIKEGYTRLLASASVFNLPDIKKMVIDVRLKEFSATRNGLLSFLPPNTIADSLLHYIPQTFSLQGNYKGTMNNLYTNLQLNTSEGNIQLTGALKNITDKNNAVYDISAATSNLQLGKLLQDSLTGNVTANIKLKGKGYNLPTANAVYDARIEEATYNHYTYRDINAAGNIIDNKLEIHIQSGDPNIELTSDTYYDMNKSNGSFRTETFIANANLLKLGFLKDTLVVRGKLSADIPVLDSTQLNGNMLATGLAIEYAGRTSRFDTVRIDADYTNHQQTIRLSSPVADMTLQGAYTIQAIPAAIKTIVNRYFYTYSPDTAYSGSVAANLHAAVHVPDSMLFFIPGLQSISPFSLDAGINTDNSAITLDTKVATIKYNGYEIDSLEIAGITIPSLQEYKKLSYGITLESITSPSVSLGKSQVQGSILHGIIEGKLELFEDQDKQAYSIPYHVVNDPLQPYLRIGDSLLINKKQWAVNKDNIIYLDVAGLRGSNLQISNKSDFIRFLADSTHPSGLPLQLSLHHFSLNNISHMFSSDTTLAEGIAEGTLSVQSLSPFSFTSDLKIDSFRVKEVNTGTLSIKVSQQPGNILLADVTLKGAENDVALLGTYNAGDKKAALKLDIQPFNLQNIEAFSTGYLGKLRGKLKGGLTINGTFDQLQIRGSIKTDSAMAVYKEYGTYIVLPSEEITFEEDGIHFNQFNFMDSAGNIGTITGKLLTSNYQEFQPDLKITTNKFLVIDKKKYPGQLIYGPAWADALIHIGGNDKAIVVDGSVKIIDKSSFTYIYTETERAGNGEGLYEFFDPSHPADTLVVAAKKKKSSGGMQIALNMNLVITPQSSVTIVLDEASGDQLRIKGAAALNITMNPGGQMSLTGNYVVESGDYDLSIAQLMKKKFLIQKGSTISWSGDPLKGEMNITAMYKVKTTAGELVKDIQSIPGIDKQKLNFEVYLFLKKELLKPDISFKLDMPLNEQEVFNDVVYNRIKQVNSIPAELNKQVMGLLVLNSFISDNPFNTAAAGAGTSLETKAYETAGNLITGELMNLVGNSVQGLDIDVALDVTENYTTGSGERRTDLKVGVTKSFAQNRLTVYVGSTFALEGQNQNATTAPGIAGDFTAEYLLTTDGKYRIKVFHLNEDDLSLQGTEVKTGVTFVVVLEFNKFAHVFKKNENYSD